MWRDKGRARTILFVALRSDTLEWALRIGGRWQMRGSGSLPLQADGAGMAAVAGALRTMAERWPEADGSVRPGEVRVMVADYWLRTATVPWSRAMRRDADASAYVRTQLAAAGHPVEVGDVVRHGDGLPGRPVLAVIYPALLWAALVDVQRGLGAAVTSLLPCSALAWTCLPGPGVLRPAMLGVSDGALAMLLRGSGTELQEVTVRQGGKSMLAILRQRAMLREAGMAADRGLPVLDLERAGTVPLSEAPLCVWQGQPSGADMPSASLQLAALRGRPGMALDAVQPAPVMTPARVLAALAMLAVTALMAGAAWQTSTRAAALNRTLAAAAVPPAALPAAPVRRSEAEAIRIRHVNQAIRTLNMPIAALLRAMEPPLDLPVSLLSVQVAEAEPSSGRGTLRLVAQAPGSNEMTRYVAYLAERRPFMAAILTQHEQDETLPARPYRFTVEVRWQP